MSTRHGPLLNLPNELLLMIIGHLDCKIDRACLRIAHPIFTSLVHPRYTYIPEFMKYYFLIPHAGTPDPKTEKKERLQYLKRLTRPGNFYDCDLPSRMQPCPSCCWFKDKTCFGDSYYQVYGLEVCITCTVWKLYTDVDPGTAIMYLANVYIKCTRCNMISPKETMANPYPEIDDEDTWCSYCNRAATSTYGA